MWYVIFKWLHILAAIAALGSNMTYGVWLGRVARDPQALLFTLRTIKIIDDRLANPAYGMSLITGLVLVFLGNWSLTTPWLMTALVLYGAAILLGFFGYTPILRQQIQLAETAGPQSEAYARVARRGTMIGIILAIIVVAIVFLMVVKPSLWG
jgi:uncharacterized membrane protein